MATCSVAIPTPIRKSEVTATKYVGWSAKLSEAKVATDKAPSIVGFSLKRSTKNPAGMEITPYAMKKEKGSKAAADKLTPKLLMMSGTSGPRMFVDRDITKKIAKT